MKCSFCGTDNEIESNFCSNCGNVLSHGDNVIIEETKNEKEVQKIADNNMKEKLETKENKINLCDGPIVTSKNNIDINNKVVESMSLSDNSYTEEKKNKKKKPVIMILISLIIVAILVVILLLVFNSSPKKIFTVFTNKLYSYTKESLDDNYDTIYLNLNLRPEIKETKNENLEEMINKISINLAGGIDYKNKKFIYNLKANYDNKALFDLDMQYDKNFYMFLNNLYDKPIMAEEDDFDDYFKKTNNNDLKVVVKSYVTAFNNSLRDEYLTKENKEITLNGVKTKVKVTTLNLTADNYKELSNNIVSYLLKDEEFIKSYAKINDKNEDDVKEYLNSITGEEIASDVKISLYTKGLMNDFVKLVISFDGTDVELVSGNSDNNFIVKVIDMEMTMLFDVSLETKYNEKINLKDVSNAVEQEELSSNFLQVLERFTDQEGYKALNDDVKEVTGSSIEELLSLLIGLNFGSDNYEY